MALNGWSQKVASLSFSIELNTLLSIPRIRQFAKCWGRTMNKNHEEIYGLSKLTVWTEGQNFAYTNYIPII